MEYDYCAKFSSKLPVQKTINHYLTNLRVWADWFVISRDELHFTLQPDSKKKFFGSLVHDETRILVVDDNREVRELLESLFKQCGIAVVLAGNGLEALRTFNDSDFDIVLTDICMPGVNGNILARQIKRSGGNIPVIAITASPALAGNHFDNVLTKPFDLEYLLETVQVLLARNARFPESTGLGQLKEKISNQKRK